MQALDVSSAERVSALSQLIPHPIEEPIPESVVYDRKAAGGKFAFLRRVLAENEKVSHYFLGDAYVMPSYGEGLVACFSKLLHAVFR
jgi:hypothetical protein